jgi:hypothetical protein
MLQTAQMHQATHSTQRTIDFGENSPNLECRKSIFPILRSLKVSKPSTHDQRLSFGTSKSEVACKLRKRDQARDLVSSSVMELHSR